MDQFKIAVTKTLPKYLEALPIPDTVEGLSNLTQDELKLLVPAVTVALVLFFATIQFFVWLISSPEKKGRVNTTIKLGDAKVVDTVQFPDAEKMVFCRCWKSKKWPMCDGSHVEHNKATGDNTGPLIVTKPK